VPPSGAFFTTTGNFNMRNSVFIALFMLAACTSPGEPEVFTSSVDVDETSVSAALAALNAVTEVDVDGLLTLTQSTPMDNEQQQRFAVSFNGEETEILYHVWREQEDWVHIYFSSESEDLIAAIEAATTPLARDGE
jgi:hypothetical protein